MRNLHNEDLGEIDDILLEMKEGRGSYAIISHGSFLGLGEKQIAVPLSHLKITADKDVFVLNVSEKQLEPAPSFERGALDKLADDTWRKMNETYYRNLR